MFEVLCFAQAPLTYYNTSGVSQPKKKEMKKKRKMVAAAAGMKATEKCGTVVCESCLRTEVEG